MVVLYAFTKPTPIFLDDCEGQHEAAVFIPRCGEAAFYSVAFVDVVTIPVLVTSAPSDSLTAGIILHKLVL